MPVSVEIKENNSELIQKVKIKKKKLQIIFDEISPAVQKKKTDHRAAFSREQDLGLCVVTFSLPACERISLLLPCWQRSAKHGEGTVGGRLQTGTLK